MLLRKPTIPLISIMTIMLIISHHHGKSMAQLLRSSRVPPATYSSSSGHPSQPSHPHCASGGADAKVKLHGFVIGFMSYGYVILCWVEHTYVHTYVHTCIQTYVLHTYICITYVHMYYSTYVLHTYICITYVHTYYSTYVLHTYMRTCVHAYMRTCVHAYMRTCVHAYMRT